MDSLLSWGNVFFFPDDITGILFALGSLKDLGHFTVYQLTVTFLLLSTS